MPRLLTTFTFLILAATLGAQQSALVEEGGGWDFGKVDQSVTLEKTLVVKNRSRHQVKIKSVKQTCGCIQAQFDAQVLEPGASAELKLTLLAARGEGEVRKFVLINSSDPIVPVLKIPVNGHIDPVWWPDFEGHVIDFGQVKNGDSATKVFRVHVKEGFELKKVEALIHPAGGPLSLTRTEVEEEGKKVWEFRLTLGGRLETGTFDGMLRLDTDFAPMPFRGYRVVAEIVSSTIVTPTRLNLGRLEKGRVFEGRIKIEKSIGTGLQLLAAESEDPRVHVDKVVLEDGKSYELHVTIRPQDGDGELRGEIVIVLEEPGQRVIRMPFHGRVAD